jgi:hypothetical protein
LHCTHSHCCCHFLLQIKIAKHTHTPTNTHPISLISVISSPNALPLEISHTNVLGEALVVIDLCKMSASQGSQNGARKAKSSKVRTLVAVEITLYCWSVQNRVICKPEPPPPLFWTPKMGVGVFFSPHIFWIFIL